MNFRLITAMLLAMGMVCLLGALAAAQTPDLTAQTSPPGRWEAVSQPGFGNPNVEVILALAPFGSHLYAGVQDSEDGADLWRSLDGRNWVSVTSNGFGDPDNIGIEHMATFRGQLYAGTLMRDDVATKSAQIWRSPSGAAGSWTQVTPSGLAATQKEIGRLVVFKDQLYATTWSYTDTVGCEVWRTTGDSSVTWTRVVSNGFGDAGNVAVISTEVFNGQLYAGTFNFTSGGEIWRSPSGAAGSWTQVNPDGFGNASNIIISALAVFNNYLYASTRATGGTGIGIQVWRCQTCDGSDWNKVVDNGFGDATNAHGSAMEVYGSHLYLVVGNRTNGLQAWRTANGIAWENIGRDGLVGADNRDVYWDNPLAVFANGLFVGTMGDVFGHTSRGQVLRYWPAAAYLPVVRR